MVDSGDSDGGVHEVFRQMKTKSPGWMDGLVKGKKKKKKGPKVDQLQISANGIF